jgi:hypothetical protein
MSWFVVASDTGVISDVSIGLRVTGQHTCDQQDSGEAELTARKKPGKFAQDRFSTV